jgi:hypothetical protein
LYIEYFIERGEEERERGTLNNLIDLLSKKGIEKRQLAVGYRLQSARRVEQG